MLHLFYAAGVFLTQLLFDLYIFLLLLRIVLGWVSADSGNPTVAFAGSRNPVFALIAKLTNPPLKPIYRFMPNLYGVDLAAILLLLGLEATKIAFLVWLQTSTTPHLGGLLVLAFAELLNQLINIFFFSIIALSILSWINPSVQNPLVEILLRISEPLLRPVRGLLPNFSGLDFSPLVIMIVLKLLTILIVNPLIQIGTHLALLGISN